MSDRQNDVLAAIDAETSKCICGRSIPENGVSLDYCSEDCQERWYGRPEVDVTEGPCTCTVGWRCGRCDAMSAPRSDTTRVMWFPTPVEPYGRIDPAAGVDLTPYLTRIDLGPSDARSTT